MKFVEKTGKTVDDAITAALVELGLPSDQVEIEIITEGSKGVLGIFGTKEAKIRATAKVASVEEQLFNEIKTAVKAEKPAAKVAEPVKETVKKENKPAKDTKKADHAPAENKKSSKPDLSRIKEEIKAEVAKAKGEEAPKEKPAKKAEPVKAAKEPVEKAAPRVPENFVMDTLVEDRLRAAKEARESQNAVEEAPKEPIEFSEDAKKAQEAAIAFLKPVLAQMGLEVEISGEMEEEDVLCLTIVGDNLGMIIGKRGNTLDSLQYLTALVANKVTQNHIKVKLDAENYREKRKQTLEKLAINLAKKARKTNRRVSLEPMNPYERRIIHSTLQSFNGVDTHSEGEEPYRKVVISPVKGSYRRKA